MGQVFMTNPGGVASPPLLQGTAACGILLVSPGLQFWDLYTGFYLCVCICTTDAWCPAILVSCSPGGSRAFCRFSC